MTETLALSVTELVEFSARTGDLYPESAGGPTALQGMLAHQKIQRARKGDWQSEVGLKYLWPLDGAEIALQGRVDLLNTGGERVIIEEIKTTLQPANRQPPGKLALFWAQARVYAGLYQKLHGAIARLELRLTLVDLPRDHSETLSQEIDGASALAETERLLHIYLAWHRQVDARLARNRASAQLLTFPFATYRSGQRELAADIYRTLRSGGALLAEAPTGTGKTVTTLFPACKALGEGHADQVLYLTAKTTSQRQVETTLDALRRNDLALDSITLCARDKLCPCRTGADELRTAEGKCAYTLGFWDRLPAARQDSLREPSLNRDTLLALAHRHKVCPSALGLHLAPWATLVLGDYNYFFDPITQLNAFAKGGKGRVLLVDELHNLAERARSMYSATLDSRSLKTLAVTASKPLRRKCKQIDRLMRGLPEQASSEAPDALLEQLLELLALRTAEMAAGPAQEDLLNQAASDDDTGLQIHRFCAVAQHFDAGHVCRVQHERGNTRVQLLCLDPAIVLRECHQQQKAVIGFSATLSPLAFHRRLLGLPETTVLRQLPYPFPADHMLVLRCDYLDTRWQAREQSMAELMELLAAVIRAKPGKYLVFFPSYDYLSAGHQAFTEQFAQHHTLCQQSGSSQTQQAEFLAAFFHDEQTVLGFAILGGLFAEGVDFLGDALHGAIVIGTGMPQPSDEQALMSAHFESQGLNAFQYAYQFPGMTRVLQTAGRVIRSAADRGVIVLVDPRFARGDFRALMPAHWRPLPCRNREAVQQVLQTFWRPRPHSDATTAADEA